MAHSMQLNSSLPAGVAVALDDFTLFPWRNCKIVHLVRHGQAYHNVAGEHDYSAYQSYDYFDAALTPLGWKQVDALWKHVENTGIANYIELVVTSPLMRTMQTAVGAFGGRKFVEGDPQSPLMIANAGNSECRAISSSNSPPFIAVEWCREHMGVHPCDKRQPISTYRHLFPAIDFSEVGDDNDVLWKADIRETTHELCERGRSFVSWLLKRKEKKIAVISHSSFLNHMLHLFGHDCSEPIKKELWKGFSNCEMRTVVLTDRRTLANPIPEDYQGGIPSGPDIPSDVADEIMENGSIL